MADRASTMTDGNRGSWIGRTDSTASGVDWDKQQRAVFQDVDNMKKQLRERLSKPEYNVSMYYRDQGIAQKIARSSLFEQVTLSVIALNALWITVDTDYNPSKILARAPWGFQLVEHLFCFFFVFEWVTRFVAFRRKIDGLRDAWFVFDTLLTLLFVADTWVMYLYMKFYAGSSGQGLGDASMLRIVRLVRLTRMARMAHLLKSVPELGILLKALGAAMRSVAFILLLLICMLYVFAVVFRLCCSEEEEFCKKYFASVPQSMHTLLIHGTFMENLESFVSGLQYYSPALSVLFYIFLILAAVTVMNMLIGILCEVVNNTAEVERESMSVSYVQHKLQAIMLRAGMSSVFKGDAKINKEEFLEMVHNPAAAAVLLDVGVDPVGLVDFADFIFKDDIMEAEDAEEGKLLSFADFVEVVLQLRGKNNATVRDIVDLRKFVQLRFANLEAKLDTISGRTPRLTRHLGRKSVMTPSASVEKELRPVHSFPRQDSQGTEKDDIGRGCSDRSVFGPMASREPPLKAKTSPGSVGVTASQDAEDTEDDCKKSKEIRDAADGTNDIDREHSDPRSFSSEVIREPAFKRKASPCLVSMKAPEDVQDTEKALANRKDGAFGWISHLVHRLLLEHESALARMQRHGERLQAELDVLKSSSNSFPAANLRVEGAVPSQSSCIQIVAQKKDCIPNEVGSTSRSERCDINLEIPQENSNDSSGRVDWVSYMAALTPRSQQLRIEMHSC